jgi:hypothetical protein
MSVSIYNWLDVPENVQAKWLSAIASSQWKINAAGWQLFMSYNPEPPIQGDLFDVVVTRGDGNELDAFKAYITLRDSDDLSYFADEVLHCCGHVMFLGSYVSRDFTNNSTYARANIASWFTHNPDGRSGTADDWAAGPWSEHISEAIAEFFKDCYRRPRKNNNRTAWDFDRSKFQEFKDAISALTCPPKPG